jgi:hypothetical protein
MMADRRVAKAGLAGLLVAGTLLSAPAAAETGRWRDEAASRLPLPLTVGLSMDAQAADLDGDGDPDLVIAMEWAQHLLLINDGTGRFTEQAALRGPRTTHDHEETVLADLDGSGGIDILIVSEDDQGKELYLNDGSGRFTDASDRIPVRGITNGARAADLDRDGDLDLVFANAGPDALLLNDGTGRFTHAADRMPMDGDVSQDVVTADLDGDGDADLVFGNEDGDRLLLNDGSGRFAAAPLPATPGETRKIGLGDVDGDGDADLYLAKTRFRPDTPTAGDRLLLNDGKAGFTDATEGRLPGEEENAAHGDLHDLDGDGDLDILSGHVVLGRPEPKPLRALLNDGTGRFTPAPESLWPAALTGNAFDSLMVDLDGDGRVELYIANRIGPDLLLVRR